MYIIDMLIKHKGKNMTETLDSFASIGLAAGVLIFALVIVGLIFTRLYKRATKELSFIRTGFGGEKVIINGGAIVLPVLHDMILVNMKTLKLNVIREKKDSLITKDRMRIDITADFYVRVKTETASISRAAQTLGNKTLEINELKTLIEAKFVDALRAVAASMDMEDLHEKRTDFVQEVQATVAEDLLKNGLELESVSLTSLDQTPAEYFDPNNAFDAEGLTVLTRKTEERKKIRNDIERDNALQIQEKDLQTRKESLALEQQEAEATAQQKAIVLKEQAERRRESEEARISSEKAVEVAQIEKEKTLEAAQIDKEKRIEEANIDKEKAVKAAEIQKSIEISNKQEAEYQAKSQANEAKAEEAKSLEAIKTAQETEYAEREKSLALINANKEAEERAIEIKVSAQAEKIAAGDKADAKILQAEGEAKSIQIKADAKAKDYEVDAKGKTDLNAAENVLSDEIINMRIKEALISNLPQIVAQVVKPMENIDSIKIVEMGGMAQGGSVAGGNATAGTGSLSNDIVDAAMKYKTHMPVLDNLLGEVGLNLNSIEGMTAPLTEMVPNNVTTAVVAAPIVEKKVTQTKPKQKNQEQKGKN